MALVAGGLVGASVGATGRATGATEGALGETAGAPDASTLSPASEGVMGSGGSVVIASPSDSDESGKSVSGESESTSIVSCFLSDSSESDDSEPEASALGPVSPLRSLSATWLMVAVRPRSALATKAPSSAPPMRVA